MSETILNVGEAPPAHFLCYRFTEPGSALFDCIDSDDGIPAPQYAVVAGRVADAVPGDWDALTRAHGNLPPLSPGQPWVLVLFDTPTSATCRVLRETTVSPEQLCCIALAAHTQALMLYQQAILAGMQADARRQRVVVPQLRGVPR